MLTHSHFRSLESESLEEDPGLTLQSGFQIFRCPLPFGKFCTAQYRAALFLCSVFWQDSFLQLMDVFNVRTHKTHWKCAHIHRHSYICMCFLLDLSSLIKNHSLQPSVLLCIIYNWRNYEPIQFNLLHRGLHRVCTQSLDLCNVGQLFAVTVILGFTAWNIQKLKVNGVFQDPVAAWDSIPRSSWSLRVANR